MINERYILLMDERLLSYEAPIRPRATNVDRYLLCRALKSAGQGFQWEEAQFESVFAQRSVSGLSAGMASLLP